MKICRTGIDLRKAFVGGGPDRLAIVGIEVVIDRLDDRQFFEIRKLQKTVENDRCVLIHNCWLLLFCIDRFEIHGYDRLFRSGAAMKVSKLVFISLAAVLFAAGTARAQVDDFCSEFGAMPTLEGPRLSAPFVYGRVTYRGAQANAKLPKISIVLIEREQAAQRITVGQRGNYCFRRTGGSSGATLVVDVDGIEVARRGVSGFGTAQIREDFEISADAPDPQSTPLLSAKFPYSRGEKATELLRKAADAETRKDIGQAITYIREATAEDAKDFIAWAKLGTLYFEQKQFTEAEAAIRRSLELKAEYTPAWIVAGQIRMALKNHEAAVEVFKHAATLEPESARVYQLLGEAYLLSKQGSLGAEALNKAIQLDPKGMAELHLQLAHLYQLAKANHLAAEEYKKFLAKVPEHPDKKKFEKFIADNPPK